MSRLAFFREGRTTSDLDVVVVVVVAEADVSVAGPGDADLRRVVIGRDLPFFLMNGTVTSCVDAILCGCASLETEGCWTLLV